ncbi:ribonuclease Z [Porphyromonas sp.]|uniref:ribonuclease Z n=1 Tax=Porphyromonas sp. TaxID=1924944 RepID=UPI0026DBFBC0|nr:ribonuclease Z [Porphyromonas sp.]MDO4771325.1 ribonuclease Z [Porphyromonas sp.]
MAKAEKKGKTVIGDGMYLQVLGCGSAKPTLSHHPSAQVLRLREKLFLIDCGEGTQLQMLRYKASFAHLHRIFITHLHGDHCLGLPGLLNSMSLLGTSHPVHVYGPKGVKRYIDLIIELFCREDAERIIVHEISPDGCQEIYADKSVVVSAFRLDHRVPTVGYLFKETPLQRHLDRASADFYGVPVAYFGRIKQGEDFVQPDGTVVPNERLTKPPRPSFSYAYCSDTAYCEAIVPYIRGVDLLYHETTFEASHVERAKETKHSTTHQAARIAELAEVGSLMIGHYSGRYIGLQDMERLRQECLTIFPRVIAANEGLVIDFKELRK